MNAPSMVDLAHRRLLLFWILCGVGLVVPWLVAGLEWRPSFVGNGVSRSCSVSSIHDGDTLRAFCEGERLKVRLYCIDAPENAQRPWGHESRDHLRRITPQLIGLRIRDTDRYGRKVGEVLTAEGANLNQQMVADGQAAVYPRYCSDNTYFNLQSQAKAQGLGIWAQPGLHQTPWNYRQANR
ncbi:MAG: thermonuclease family protein [Lamprobacter sp.]|uniref:thermonuclease family protein n=1 Tax=Lamprobacter sp. TaxID=3100796 RepID=UPI002B264633|nr:thermonuclease family protein [Lamprobacter sp.]MEA3640248.1 thermonuclease family protein [Lamprobacter sp.]